MSDVIKSELKSDVQTIQRLKNSDEINLLEYIYVLVKHRWWIIGATVFGIVAGVVLAKLKGPTWVAEVVIAPKETETQKTPNLSSLGAFGGMVASQLSFGGNPGLDKMDRLLESRDFNARLIEKYDLLPELYRCEWPKLYAENWDSSANTWRNSFKKPQPLKVGKFLKNTFLKKNIKDNCMTLEVSSHDSAFSYTLASCYVEFLDKDIKERVRKDAKENVVYLEKQLAATGDPLTREKIQTLIADEIEKMMMVSNEAFSIVDPVYLQSKFREKRVYPILFGSVMFFFVAFVVVAGHTLFSSDKTEEDKRLIKMIVNELLFR